MNHCLQAPGEDLFQEGVSHCLAVPQTKRSPRTADVRREQ